jgi:murein DD-endopeptidase MepM/ murein hydrolase activator NlpD
MTRLGWIFLGVLAFGLIGFLAVVRINPATTGPATAVATSPASSASTEPAGRLLVPVAGLSATDLARTFDDPREDGARRHGAIDIAAPRGTPVVAAADGTVEKLFGSEAGGNTVYIRSPGARWVHYYAHLDSYAPGLAEGGRVAAGQRIGTVGSSGNADPTAPHLHFEVKRMMPGEAWHQGNAVDPFDLLAQETVAAKRR